MATSPAPKTQDTGFLDIRSPGVKGLNVFDDAAAIGDQELAEAENVIYDGGILAPRPGSTLFAEKPSGETEDPLQFIVARTSDGIAYKIIIYGNHFWLYHPENKEWIQINPLFTPEETDKLYGWVNWNNGRGDDRLYACNGVDAFWRWDLALSRLDGNHAAGVTELILEDATRFPDPTSGTISTVDTGDDELTVTSHGLLTGDMVFYDTDGTEIDGLTDGGVYFVITVDANTIQLAASYDDAIDGTEIDLTSSGSGTQKIFGGQTVLIIQGGGTTEHVGYTAKSGNSLTLASGLVNTFGNESSVVTMVSPKPSMEIGKIVAKNQKRLFTSNYLGGETTIWFSVQDDPEDFTTGANVEDAGTEVIADGYGEITGLHDFGQFLVIEKEDSLHRLRFQLADDLGSKLTQIEPVLSGQSVGPLGLHSTVKVFNTLVYPTKSEGFLSTYPAGTGDSTSVSMEPISQKIQPLVTKKISYADCRGVAFDRKVLWSVGKIGATENSFSLMYDLEREAWTKILSWAVKDWGYDNGELFYLEAGTGDVFQAFTKGYNDANNPYQVRAALKRNDFGKLSKPKTNDKIYVEGYMTPATQLYIDVLFNEGGLLKKQTYLLNKDTENLYISQPLTNALGQPIMGVVALGYVSLLEIGDLSFFRCYLGISNRSGYYNLQLQFRQNKEAFFAIAAVGYNPIEELVIPSTMVISPTVES